MRPSQQQRIRLSRVLFTIVVYTHNLLSLIYSGWGDAKARWSCNTSCSILLIEFEYAVFFPRPVGGGFAYSVLHCMRFWMS